MLPAAGPGPFIWLAAERTGRAPPNHMLDGLEMAEQFFVVSVHICEGHGVHLSVIKMISLVLLVATFDLTAAQTTNPCNSTINVTITNTHANPWCESTCVSLSSECTINMPSTTLCSERTEYTCELPADISGNPPCHWNSTTCITWPEYCNPLNESLCNSTEFCKFLPSTNICTQNNSNTAFTADGAHTLGCIDCSSFSGEANDCNNLLFCYHNGSTCKRTPEAPKACSADDDDDDNNMPLILGLSIGLGVPFVLVVIYFTVIRKRGFTILDSATEGFLNG